MIITLCGSSRFEKWYHAWNKALTVMGHTVFSLTAFPSQEVKREWYSPEMKQALDAAHFRKIEASDAIFVLNVMAYIGPSTLNEIRYASKLRKKLIFLESWGEGCGICGMHYPRIQKRAKELGVPCNASPINTFPTAHRWDPWKTEVLGDAGPLRESVLKFLKEAGVHDDG